jgi:hypothetical protein
VADLRLERLFHTLVVVGAALPGCGAREVADSLADGGDAAASSTDARDPMSPVADARDAFVDGGAAKTAADCPTPFQFHCQGSPPVCVCDPHALTPAACEAAGQFVCERYDPYFDSCRCDLTAPKSIADCPDAGMPGCFEYYSCQSMSPQYGCSCVCIATIR